VYISEAHPDDEWQMESNREDGVVLNQPKTGDERNAAARILVERLGYRIPLAVDGIDGRAEKVFAAWPERIYILDRGGTVLYKGGMGPFDFDPGEAEKSLAACLGPRARPG
jgi:Iodothyronine deiodinase